MGKTGHMGGFASLTSEASAFIPSFLIRDTFLRKLIGRALLKTDVAVTKLVDEALLRCPVHGIWFHADRIDIKNVRVLPGIDGMPGDLIGKSRIPAQLQRLSDSLFKYFFSGPVAELYLTDLYQFNTTYDFLR